MTTTDNSTYISRRPSWADETRIESEGVLHMWKAPTIATGADVNLDGVEHPISVELMRDDALLSNSEGVYVDPGTTVLVVDGTINIRSPQEGRRLAQAISEACDRWESAADGSPRNFLTLRGDR